MAMVLQFFLVLATFVLPFLVGRFADGLFAFFVMLVVSGIFNFVIVEPLAKSREAFE